MYSKKNLLWLYRGTFVVDPEGFVRTAEIHDMGIGRSAEELVH